MAAIGRKANRRQVKRWWQQYRQTQDLQLRNRLLEHYLPLVRGTAERLHARLPARVDLADLISNGNLGLMRAVEAYDPDRHIKFETYCQQRIWGAILDGLRATDWAPRLVRDRARKLAQAAQVLEARLGRKPTDAELAEKLHLPMKQFRRVQRDAQVIGLVSLSRICMEAEEGEWESAVLEDKRGEDPYTAALRKEIRELVTQGLNPAERMTILLYYFEEMNMKEIGATLGLSESRVSQMRTEILARLREKFLVADGDLQVG